MGSYRKIRNIGEHNCALTVDKSTGCISPYRGDNSAKAQRVPFAKTNSWQPTGIFGVGGYYRRVIESSCSRSDKD